MSEPRLSHLLNPVHCLSLGLGSGLMKPAPGTWGSLAAMPLWWLLAQLPLSAYLVVCLIAALIGIYLCGATARALGVHDHSAIVWDEFVGVWIAMIALPVSWQGALLGFVLFRLFDIWKPWPIRYFDKNVHGGLGIMLDDIVAGVMACAWAHILLIVWHQL